MKPQTKLLMLASSCLLAGMGHAAPILFQTVQIPENPANASLGVMSGSVSLDTATHQIVLNVTFSGLTGTTTNSHIHCCTAAPLLTNPAQTVGVATQTPTFPGFPAGVTSGTYNAVFDTSLNSSWNAAFINANGGTPLLAEAALLNGLLAGEAYWNIHSTFAGGGEIRAVLQRVPEPASLGLIVAGLLGLGWSRRKLTR